MARKRLRIIAVVASLIVGMLVLGGLGVWQLRLRPWLIFDKTRYSHMRQIMVGFREFTEKERRLPTDLSDVIDAGCLPADSPIYRCPLLHGSLRDVSISYKRCEFDIRFEPNEVIVAVPRRAVDVYELSEAPAYLVECRIDRSGNVSAY